LEVEFATARLCVKAYDLPAKKHTIALLNASGIRWEPLAVARQRPCLGWTGPCALESTLMLLSPSVGGEGASLDEDQIRYSLRLLLWVWHDWTCS